MAFPGFALSSDVFQGRWTGKGPDWRWYRQDKTYLSIFAEWKKAGGIGAAILFLKKKQPSSNWATRVSDALARQYLGLEKSATLTAAQRQQAQKAYEQDLFDWWWTTPGLDPLSYTDKNGIIRSIKPGVLIRKDGVFNVDGTLVLRRAITKPKLVYKDPVTKATKVIYYGSFTAPPGATGKWWRKLEWFMGIADGSLSFSRTLAGAAWGKSWLQTFTEEAASSGLGRYSARFQQYVRDVAKAAKKNDRAALATLLEQWLTNDASIFAGVPAGKGLRVTDFFSAPLVFSSQKIGFSLGSSTDRYKSGAPRWATWEAGKPGVVKASTAKTRTLIVFGDSISDGYHSGDNGTWLAQLVNALPKSQRDLFRALNYAVSGNRTDEILVQVRALMPMLKALLGKVTVVLAAGGNDVSDADVNDTRNPDRYRFQTNTLANLRESALLLASLGFDVVLARSLGVSLSALESIAAEVRARYKNVHVIAIDFTKIGIDKSKGETLDGVHRTAAGNKTLAEWLLKQAGFASLLNPAWSASVYKPDAAHWWRSNAWFVNNVLGLDGGWKTFWTGAGGTKADAAYAAKVRKAFAAHAANPSNATFDALAALLESWLKGEVGTGSSKVTHYFAGKTFVFGPDKVSLSGSNTPYDPDGSGTKYSPMKNSAYKPPAPSASASKPPAWSASAYKADAAHWWRSNAWFVNNVLGLDGGWKTFWTGAGGTKADAAYAAKVRKAFAAHAAKPSNATFDALAALLESWLKGEVGTGSSKVTHYFAGKTFVFGPDKVSLSGSNTPYDPDGSGTKYPPLKNPAYKPPAWSASAYKADAAHWWRSNAWFVNNVLGLDGGWKKFWTGAGGTKADAAYAAKVRKAFAAHAAKPSNATFDALAALLESWLKGEVGTGSSKVTHYFAGKTFVFGPDKVSLSGSNTPYDPDGSGTKYPPLKNPAYKPPAWSASAYKADAAHWWRSNAWFVNTVLGLEGGWKTFWTGAGGTKADAAYAAKVRKAFAAHAAKPSNATFDALAALLESWLKGEVGSGSSKVTHYFAGKTFVFGPDKVSLSGSNTPYDPDGSGTKYPPLKNPAYKPPAWSASAYKADAAHWWRSNAWFVNNVLGLDGGWKKFWTGAGGTKADAAYAAKVRKAFAAHAAKPSNATFDALAALLESWLKGEVGTGSSRVTHYFAGKTFVFGPDKVSLSGSNTPYDPDGSGTKYPPLKNPNPPKTGKKEVLVIGDSLSDTDWGGGAVWTRLLQGRLDAEGFRNYLVNEQATAGMATRTVTGPNGVRKGAREALDQALAKNPHPSLIVIGIGVNNMTRGVSLADTEADIRYMVRRAQASGAKVLLLGMYLPPGLKKSGPLSDADKAWLKKHGIDSMDADGWSKGLQKIYDMIAAENAANKNFAYVPSYWDPIDGSDNQLDSSELQGAADNIHPSMKDQNALFQNVWNKLRSLLPKTPSAPLPDISTPIKNFVSYKVYAGDDAHLKFNLAGPNSVQSILRVKFWATIQDIRAGAKNHGSAESGYVNFKYFHVSFDDGKTWIYYDNSQKNPPEIIVPAGVTSVTFRFKTYAKAPFDALLHANIGKPAKSYSTLIDTDGGPQLYVRDDETENPINIGDIIQGADSHTCYFLASLQAVIFPSAGAPLVANLIKKTFDGYEVTFGETKINVTRNAVFYGLWNPDAARAGRSGMELWVRVLEYAWLEYSKLKISQDGSPKSALELLTGRPVDEINGGSYGVDLVLALLQLNASGKGKDYHYIVVGTLQTISKELQDKGLRANHAYSVVGFSGEYYILWDPLSGTKIQVSTKDLRAISERFFITDLRNGDKNPIDANYDVGGKLVPAKPELYVRAYGVVEHKLKDVDPASAYKTFSGSFGAYGEDGRKANLVKLAKQIRDYNARHRGVEFGRDPASFGADQNLLIVPVEKKENNVTYVELQYWALTEDRSGTFLMTTIRLDPKWAYSYRITRETTIGPDVRFYYEPGKDLGAQLANRFQAGGVFSTQQNYELIWDSTSANPKKWQSRRRLRISFAGEAFFFGGPEGGGVKFSARFKGQYQMGWLKKDSTSIWMTLGFDIGAVLGLGNFTSSFDELITASERDDKAAFMEHLAAFLGRIPSGAIYIGPTVLFPNAMLNLTTKIADWLEKKWTKRNADRESLLLLRAMEADTPETEAEHVARLEKLMKVPRLERFVRNFGEYFHNVKVKVEVGGVWFTTDYKSGGLKGDGSYGGAPDVKSFADQLWALLAQTWKLPDEYQKIFDQVDIASFLKLAPEDVGMIFRALNERTEIWSAFGHETWKVMNAGDKGLGLGAKSIYRDFLATMSSSTQEAIIFGLVDTMMGTLMSWYIQATEDLAAGKTPELLRMPEYGKNGIESLASYSAYLATRVPDLIEGALKKLLSSTSEMTAMLLYLAAYYTPTVMEKILAEWQERAKASSLAEPLTDKELSDVRREARSRAFYYAGFADSVSESLADAADFKSIAKKQGWTAEQEADALRKIDGVAKDNATVTDLQKIANNAFKSGMTVDEAAAFDELRRQSSLFDRSLARALTLSPDDLEKLLEGKSTADAAAIRKALASAAEKLPDNSVLKALVEGDLWSGLTPAQAAYAKQIKLLLMSGENPIGEAEANKMAKAMATSTEVDFSKPEAMARAVDRAKAFRAAISNLDEKGIFDKAKGGAAGAALAFIPFAMALAGGNSASIAAASASLLSNVSLLAIEMAAGPVGWAFAIITTAMSLLEKPVDRLIAKNPLYALIPAVALTFAFNKAVNAFNKVLTSIFKGIFDIFGTNRRTSLDPLQPSELAMLAYKAVWDEEYAKAKADPKNQNGEEGWKNAANATVLLKMIADGVVTTDSFVNAMSSDGSFDSSKLFYDLNRIRYSTLAQMVAWDVLSSCFDPYSPFYINAKETQKPKGEVAERQNREILRAVLDRMGANSGGVNRDQVRFFSHWLNLGTGVDDLFETEFSQGLGNNSDSGYGFIGEYKQWGQKPFANGAYIQPTQKFIDWLTDLFETGMLQFRSIRNAKGESVYALTFGNTLDGSDLAGVDAATKTTIIERRKTGLRSAMMAYSYIWGDKNEFLSADELVTAINDMLPAGLAPVDYRWVDFVLSTYQDDFSPQIRKGGYSWGDVYDMMTHVFYFDAYYGGMGFRIADNRAFTSWQTIHITGLVIRTWGQDYDGTDGSGKIKVADLENALWRLGALSGGTDDNQEFLKFLAYGWTRDKKDELKGADLAALVSTVGSFESGHLEINAAAFGREAFIQAVKIIGKGDDKISAEDLLNALNWFLPGSPYLHIPSGRNITPDRDEWYYTLEDARLGNNSLYRDTVLWMHGGDPNIKGDELTVEQFRSLVNSGALDWFIRERTPERFRSQLPGLDQSPPVIYTNMKAMQFTPVVLDLDGDGLEFTPLSKSTAQYDVDGSGVRRNLSWIGQGDGLLAFDANGDGRITQANEVSFVGYKKGAKTDLEGLAAFDTNGNGKLDAGDAAWKKFVIWIDRNGDGRSDDGELLSLDDLGIASIDLTSDGKRQNLDGATLFGTTTFTLKDGRKGTVGDVAFSVANGSLSPAEIARRRDLLVQALASGKPMSAPGVFTPSINPGESPNLMRNSAGR